MNNDFSYDEKIVYYKIQYVKRVKDVLVENSIASNCILEPERGNIIASIEQAYNRIDEKEFCIEVWRDRNKKKIRILPQNADDRFSDSHYQKIKNNIAEAIGLELDD